MIDLSAFIRPDETALQLYARNYVEPVQTGTFFCQTVIPGQIIEICGRSGSGKTTFLLQVEWVGQMKCVQEYYITSCIQTSRIAHWMLMGASGVHLLMILKAHHNDAGSTDSNSATPYWESWYRWAWRYASYIWTAETSVKAISRSQEHWLE